MKLYYSPGACSLADRIWMRETGIIADYVEVDLKTKVTKDGEDFRQINPKGSVPVLVLDDGQRLTENVAILTFLDELEPANARTGLLRRFRMIEALSFLSSELHVAFRPLWSHPEEPARADAIAVIANKLQTASDMLRDGYLVDSRFSVADAYLFVMLRWARFFDVPCTSSLQDYLLGLSQRESVRCALADEGLADTTSANSSSVERVP